MRQFSAVTICGISAVFLEDENAYKRFEISIRSVSQYTKLPFWEHHWIDLGKLIKNCFPAATEIQTKVDGRTVPPATEEFHISFNLPEFVCMNNIQQINFTLYEAIQMYLTQQRKAS